MTGWVWANALWAGPSELNFQGVLLDVSGNGVTGTRAMTVKLYDAAIGGNLLYTEDLGNVSVNKGVYSFYFGTNGTGNPKVTETVALTDGTATTFQKVLANTNVVSGSVSVTDGTYSWDQTNGSSDGGVNFDASYSSSLRRITVNYYGTIPAVGRTISVSYRSPSSGAEAVLMEDSGRWIEVSINGVSQSPRQKLLTVPYAVRATSIASEGLKTSRTVKIPVKRFNRGGYLNATFPLTTSDIVGNLYQYGSSKTGVFEIPSFAKKIISMAIRYTNVSQSASFPAGTVRNGSVTLTILDSALAQLYTITYSSVVSNYTSITKCDIPIQFGSQSSLQIISSTGIYRPNQEESLGYSTIHAVDLEVETQEASSW